MAKRIIVVEDNRLTQEELVEAIPAEFPSVEVIAVSTEREFRDRVPEFRRSPPAVFLIDVMLRWDNPRPVPVEPPQSVKEDSYYRAGLRCADLVFQMQDLRRVPVVLFTALDRRDVARDAERALPRHVKDVVMKDGSFVPLFRAVGKYLK
jgi:CheY-like chemotaxis protein